jgi:uncharacterized protein with von Willebrand factor type A (vWA) domain
LALVKLGSGGSFAERSGEISRRERGMDIIQYFAWKQVLKGKAYLVKVPREVVEAIDKLLETTAEYRALAERVEQMEREEAAK